MLRKMSKVLLVGSGMTGAASAALLRQHLPENVSISIWDKARGAGGRMATSRSAEDSSVTVDLGAQYITLFEEYKAKRQSLYEELQAQGILTPLQGKIEGQNRFYGPGAQHFVTPQGVSSLVKYFLGKAKATIKYQQHVSEVSIEANSQVSVTTSNDVTEQFDIVVLTLPVPQILQLRGSLHEAIGSQPDVKKNLLNVKYSSRFALGLFYPPGSLPEYPWCAKYESDDPCIRFIGIDPAKRGVAQWHCGQSVAVHTSVPFGLAHLEEDPSSVKDEILEHLHTLLPDLPKPASVKPQKWRYSQTYKAYEGKPGCVIISTNPLVILAGDGFTQSTFDGCLDSAEAVLGAVRDLIQTGPSSGL